MCLVDLTVKDHGFNSDRTGTLVDEPTGTVIAADKQPIEAPL